MTLFYGNKELVLVKNKVRYIFDSYYSPNSRLNYVFNPRTLSGYPDAGHFIRFKDDDEFSIDGIFIDHDDRPPFYIKLQVSYSSMLDNGQKYDGVIFSTIIDRDSHKNGWLNTIIPLNRKFKVKDIIPRYKEVNSFYLSLMFLSMAGTRPIGSEMKMQYSLWTTI